MLSVVYGGVACVLVVVYVWVAYNLPVLAAGVRRLRGSARSGGAAACVGGLPFVSVVVPVRDEGRVVRRLLDALLRLDYPRGLREIVVVEDGSSDDTLRVCLDYASRFPGEVRVFSKPESAGKASALNYALSRVRGEVVAFFDADSVPAVDVLRRAVVYFRDARVAAVQGRTLSINAEENMLTRFVAFEEAVWCEAYLGGKDALGLFVHLRGSCMFLRRSVLSALGGFAEDALSEDMELSARLLEHGYAVRYASDVRAWQESPGGLRQLVAQRTRWFRGTMEVAVRYGRLMARLDRRRLDAEATLFGPFVLIASLAGYFVAVYGFASSSAVPLAWQWLLQFTAWTTTVLVVLLGLALVYVARPRRLSSVLWLPFIYFYWCMQAFVAVYAAVLTVSRRPKRWVRTPRSGVVTSHVLCEASMVEQA